MVDFKIVLRLDLSIVNCEYIKEKWFGKNKGDD